MAKLSLWLSASALLATLSSPALAQAPNLRTGGWELNLSLNVGNAPPHVNKIKSCITKEDIATMRAFEKDENCKYQYTTRSATRVSGSQICVRGGEQRKGEFDIQFLTPESYLMNASSRVVAKPGSEVRMEIKGRWASPSCVGYDD